MSGLPGLERDPSRLEVRAVGRHGRLRGGHRHLLRAPARRRAAAATRASRSREGYGAPGDGADLDGPRRDLPVRGRGGEAPAARRSDGAAHILDWYDRRRSSARVPGVVEVNAFGGELKTYEVQLDPTGSPRFDDLRCGDVFEALERNNAQRRRRLHRARRRAVPDPRRGAGRRARRHRRHRGGARRERARRSSSRRSPTCASRRWSARARSRATAAARRRPAS